METVLAATVGTLFACGFYLLLRRSLVRVVLGLAVLSQGVNLLLFTAGRPVAGRPPLVPPGNVVPPAPVSDPLPQALILTAIVIGFALQAFALVLLRRTGEATGTDDVDRLPASDSASGPEEAGR